MEKALLGSLDLQPVLEVGPEPSSSASPAEPLVSEALRGFLDGIRHQRNDLIYMDCNEHESFAGYTPDFFVKQMNVFGEIHIHYGIILIESTFYPERKKSNP